MKTGQFRSRLANILPSQQFLAGKVMGNISWLFFDKAVRMAISLFVGVWIARYLGPAQFGVFSYAMALVAIFASITTLGMQAVVVRDIVSDPSNAGEILGTAAVLQLLAAMIAYLGILLLAQYFHTDEAVLKWAVSILGLSLLFRASDSIKHLFEAMVQSRYVVWAEVSVILVSAALKIGLILTHAPLLALIGVAVVESALIALSLIVVLRANRDLSGRWSFHLSRAKLLLKNSWPLLLSGIAIMIYMRIDQVMLKSMTDDVTVGEYSVALRLSEVWYFIPMIIVPSIFPSIIEMKKRADPEYLDRLKSLFKILLLLAIAIAIPTTFLTDWVVNVVFGADYAGASSVLVIHIWSSVFVFMGVAGGHWLVLENLQILSLERTILGAVVNVGLNLLLIPQFGGVGAASASLIAYSVSGLFADLLHKKTRPIFFMKLGISVVQKN